MAKRLPGRERARTVTAILGISAFYHDSAAALVVDGRIVAAAQEERFTRRKHDHRFPQNAIDYCLREAGLDVTLAFPISVEIVAPFVIMFRCT